MQDEIVLRVALIGDYNPQDQAHRAIPISLQLASDRHKVVVEPVWVSPASIKRPEKQLVSFAAIWCVPGIRHEDRSRVERAISYAIKADKPLFATGDGARFMISQQAHRPHPILMSEETGTSADSVTVSFIEGSVFHQAYRRKQVTESDPLGLYVNPRFAEKNFVKFWDGPLDEWVPDPNNLWHWGYDQQGRIKAFTSSGRYFSVGVLFQPELRALKGELPPLVSALVKKMKELELIRMRHPVGSTSFILFDKSWYFFPLSVVRRGQLSHKTGSVHYRGGFSVMRLPAYRIPFAETQALVQEINTAWNGGHTKPPVSFAKFQKLEKMGNPILLEFGLKTKTELGRRCDCFTINAYRNRIELRRSPWKQGGFWPWPDWTETIKFSKSRDRALERAVRLLQIQYAPRGFQFKPGKGLLPETKSLR